MHTFDKQRLEEHFVSLFKDLRVIMNKTAMKLHSDQSAVVFYGNKPPRFHLQTLPRGQHVPVSTVLQANVHASNFSIMVFISPVPLCYGLIVKRKEEHSVLSVIRRPGSRTTSSLLLEGRRPAG